MYLDADKEPQLTDSLQKEDFENYRIYIHALKSTSLNIGAEGLASRAKELEYACRDGKFEEVRARHGSLMEKYRHLMGSLRCEIEETGGEYGEDFGSG